MKAMIAPATTALRRRRGPSLLFCGDAGSRAVFSDVIIVSLIYLPCPGRARPVDPYAVPFRPAIDAIKLAFGLASALSFVPEIGAPFMG
jgi:hypothetical protein